MTFLFELGTPPPVRKILCLGLNPAFQTTLHFQQFEKGEVNRAYKKTHSIGGKGQNFAMACEQYGAAHDVTLLQFVGGTTGEYIRNVLDEKGIHHVTVETSKSTRTCTTVLDSTQGDMTELIEPPAMVSHEERDRLETLAREMLFAQPNQASSIQAIALCGTFPGGVRGDTFARIIQSAPADASILLDAYKDIECVLETGRVTFFKINREELQSITAPFFGSLMGLPSIKTMAHALLTNYSIEYLGITNGPHTAHLFHRTADNCTLFDLPILESMEEELSCLQKSPLVGGVDRNLLSQSLPSPVETPREAPFFFSQSGVIKASDPSPLATPNPLGAGDTASAVFLVEYLKSKDPREAFRHALAAASASCLVSEQTAHFDIEIMRMICCKITISTPSKDVTM